MIPEISFLLEILFDHKSFKSAKDAIRARVKELDASPVRPQVIHNQSTGPQQAASTLALMAKHGVPNPTPLNDPASVENIAQTAVTAQALQQANMIKGGIKPPTTAEGRPRKW